MANERRAWRFGEAFLAVLVVGVLGVLGWCGQLQLGRWSEYQKRVERQQLKLVPWEARRGMIVDRRGRVLAVSTRGESVRLDPVLLEDAGETSRQLGGILGLDAAGLLEKIDLRRGSRFLWVKRFVTKEQAEAVRGLEFRGVVVESEYRREYPMGQLAAHVLGYTDVDGRGLEGVEREYDEYLSGESGLWRLRSDAMRRPVGAQGGSRGPRHGRHLVLTIDAVIQTVVEEQLAATVERFQALGASAVVMDVRTGEVLALANVPTFNPAEARQSDPEVRRNRALTDPVEPGSTFKPFTVAAAIEGGYVKVDTAIFCHNGLYAGRGIGVIREYENHGYGELTVAEIIARSSNIGSAKVAQKMGKEYFFGMIEKFGFGQETGIDLPGEGAGILMPLSEWKWGQYALTRAAYGQGPVAVTAMQLVRGFACLSNGGRLVTPRVGRAVLEEDGRVGRDFVGEALSGESPQVISEGLSREMVGTVLRGVVSRPGGTAHNVDLAGYGVYGKTGTAQVPRRDGCGYAADKYVASFVAGAPGHEPRIVVLVMVREPDRSLGLGYTGGRVAAPAVRAILEQTLAYLGVEGEAESVCGGAWLVQR